MFDQLINATTDKVVRIPKKSDTGPRQHLHKTTTPEKKTVWKT
jgi:hypothetical protein